MKRIQLFEFEDFQWFPSWLRTCMTNLLVVLLKLMGVSEALAKILAPILREKKINQLVDLGSGSGGAMPEVLAILQTKYKLDTQLTLTDLYPNAELAEALTNSQRKITYHKTPVDATNFEQAPAGLKTMINCFHHMPPAAARQILESASRNKQPLLIFEMAENKLPLVIWWLFLPLSLLITFIMALLLTPMVRPLRWRQLVFTYLIPIIPLFYAWDGQASMPRMYAAKDIEKLTLGLNTDQYEWKTGFGEGKNGKKVGTYLLGMPK